MNTLINKLIAMILTFALVMTSFSFASVSYAATDTEGPVVDLDSLELSTQTITDPYEMPKVKIKVTDETGVESVTLYYCIDGKANAGNSIMEYNEDTGYFEGEIVFGAMDWSGDVPIPVGYYGEYVLYNIDAVDYYGNFTFLNNLDIPKGNFEIIGGNPKDEAAPVVDFDNIAVEKNLDKGQSTVMTIPIDDDSKILEGHVWYSNQNGDSVVAHLLEKSDGIYQADLKFNYEGEYQLESIYVTDAHYNDISIVNSDHFNYVYNEYDERIAKGLGYLNIQHGQSAPTELYASIKSMELSSAIMNRNAQETLTVTFNASSPLQVAYAGYDFRRGNTQMGSGPIGKKIDDYTFQFDLPSEFYGQWYLTNISVTDMYGNQELFYDTERTPFTDGVEMNFSNGEYDHYVGIVDDETGLGVSDTEFDDTTALLVEEESLKSDLCEEMVEDDGIGIAFYDVEVEGKRDDETVVSFVAPEGLIDGDEVTIVHKRHNGKHEKFDAKVKHGRITIETDEFSPFLVQIDKDHKHRYVKKPAVAATCTKKGKTEGKYCSLCGKVSVEQKTVAVDKNAHPKASIVTLKGKAATCTATGLEDGKKCSDCGVVTLAKKTIKKKPHTYSSKWTVDKVATTSKNGSKSKHCTNKKCTAKKSVTTIYKLKDVKLKTKSFVYDGNQKSPKIVVTNSKGKVIASSNYEIKKPAGRKNVGKYTYTVTFKNDYKGIKAKKLTLTINPKATSIKEVKAAKKAFTVKWAQKTTQVTGYQICYGTSTNKDKCKKVLVKKNTTVSKKITGLTKGKKYNVWIRTYKTVGDTKYYSAWSAKKTVKVK